jgi:hypothetical protein
MLHPAWESTLNAYDSAIQEAKEVMIRKNHDYGDVWREMRPSSLTDEVLIKIRRVKRLEDLEDLGQSPKVSEGKRSEYRDIINYCVFAMIRMDEIEKSKQKEYCGNSIAQPTWEIQTDNAAHVYRGDNSAGSHLANVPFTIQSSPSIRIHTEYGEMTFTLKEFYAILDSRPDIASEIGLAIENSVAED